MDSSDIETGKSIIEVFKDLNYVNQTIKGSFRVIILVGIPVAPLVKGSEGTSILVLGILLARIVIFYRSSALITLVIRADEVKIF